MRVTLPDKYRTWLQDRADLEGHTSVDSYVEKLIQREVQFFKEALDNTLLQSLASGEPVRADEGFWNERLRILEEKRHQRGKAAS